MKYFQGGSGFINQKFNNSIQAINLSFEIQLELFEIIAWTLHRAIQATNETTPIATSGFYKSLLSIYGCFSLTQEGQYGSGRIILRHAFEYSLEE